MYKVITLIVSVFLIATTAIAMECYNKNTSWSNSKKTNYNFLIFMIVSAVLSFVAAGAAIAITKSP
jgi:hypothetical protein